MCWLRASVQEFTSFYLFIFFYLVTFNFFYKILTVKTKSILHQLKTKFVSAKDLEKVIQGLI